MFPKTSSCYPNLNVDVLVCNFAMLYDCQCIWRGDFDYPDTDEEAKIVLYSLLGQCTEIYNLSDECRGQSRGTTLSYEGG